MNPRYPVYIPSKGRYESRLTAKAFDKMGVPYREVIEENEEADYRSAGAKNPLVMPQHNRGVVITRNYLWDHARDSGAKRYWTFDDNISGIVRYNNNTLIKVLTGAALRVQEDFVGRYLNIPIAGMQYYMFVTRKLGRWPVFTLNKRIYSNMLIDTNCRDPSGRPYRFEGFYNEDTDLCLRVLKDGYCTVLFHAFLIMKNATMKMKGGNTPNYAEDGRWKMAEELRRKHPDVTELSWRFGRVQHKVNYKKFRKNRLIRNPAVEYEAGVNEYGMELVEKK